MVGIVGYKTAVFALSIPMRAMAVWSSILTAKQWLLNMALSANPIGIVVGALFALAAIVAVVVHKYDQWGATLSFVLGPIGMVISLIQSFRRHWDSIKKAFEDDGIVAGLKRIGLVMLDALLMPLQQLLEIASKIPGAIGSYADLGASKIESFRNKLNLTPEVVSKLEVNSKGKLEDPSGKEKKLTEDLGDGSDTSSKKGLGDDSSAEKDDSLSKGIDSINGGGTKHTNINITYGNLIGEQNIEVSSNNEAVEELEEQIMEGLFRVLNAANEMQNQ